MSWISLMYTCPNCSQTFSDLVRVSERAGGSTCTNCGSPCAKENEAMTAPNVSTRTSAAKPDGLMKDSTKKLIEAARLQSTAFDLRPSERGSINKEIKRLKGGDLK